MPIKGSTPKSTPKSGSRKKKKKGFFDRIPGSKLAANTVDDLADVAKGTPRGVFELGKAGASAAVLRDFKPGLRLGKEMLEQTREDLRHPLRHPGYSLLDILGIAPILGAPAKAARIGRGAKRPPTRVLKHRVRSTQEGERFAKALGSTKPYRVGAEIKQEIPASRMSTTRAAVRGIDKARSKSGRASRRKMEKVIARKQDVRGRLFDENPKGIIGATKEAFGTKEPLKALAKKPVREGVREGNAFTRGLRLYRGAYVPPNRLGSEIVNLIHTGPVRYPKGVVSQARERIKNRPLAKDIDRLGGETMGQAMMETGSSGPIGTFMRGVGTTLGKVTDLGPRNRIWREEARRMGYKPEDVSGLISSAKAGNPKSLQDLYLITDRAERAAIKFTRTGPMRDITSGKSLTKKGIPSKIDSALADNIFLYKWLTASGRYGGHMLAEHPTLSALLAGLSRATEDQGIDSVLAEHPSFMDNYLPTGNERDGNPLVRNPTAAGLFDMPFETIDALENSGSDIREISDILNPVQASAMNAITGFDPFRDQEIGEFKDSPWDRAKFGAATQLRSIPWLEWQRINDSPDEREGRLFPLTPWDIIQRQLLGSSLSYTGFPVNPDIAAKMYRQQEQKGKNKPKRRKRRRSSGGF